MYKNNTQKISGVWEKNYTKILIEKYHLKQKSTFSVIVQYHLKISVLQHWIVTFCTGTNNYRPPYLKYLQFHRTLRAIALLSALVVYFSNIIFVFENLLYVWNRCPGQVCILEAFLILRKVAFCSIKFLCKLFDSLNPLYVLMPNSDGRTSNMFCQNFV